jgi:hypothetical protein
MNRVCSAALASDARALAEQALVRLLHELRDDDIQRRHRGDPRRPARALTAYEHR